MTSEARWVLDFDDHLALPGWLVLPPGLVADEREDWKGGVADALAGVESLDGHLLDPVEISDLLEEGLRGRDASPSLAVMQVWPPFLGETAMCHVDLLPSTQTPSWSELTEVVHRIESTGLGSGFQIVTRRTSHEDVTSPAEVTGVTVVFQDDELMVVLGLVETLEPLVLLALPSFEELVDRLRIVHSIDDRAFTGVIDDRVEDRLWNAQDMRV